MTTASLLKRGLGFGLALVVVLLIVGQLLGQPILLGYVATGSMEPTMDAGDGFVSVPALSPATSRRATSSSIRPENSTTAG